MRQLESVAVKGKPLASPSALVRAMFAVELHNLLLTAGHDADTVQPPLVVDRSNADERFVGLGHRPDVGRAGCQDQDAGSGKAPEGLFDDDDDDALAKPFTLDQLERAVADAPA